MKTWIPKQLKDGTFKYCSVSKKTGSIALLLKDCTTTYNADKDTYSIKGIVVSGIKDNKVIPAGTEYNLYHLSQHDIQSGQRIVTMAPEKPKQVKPKDEPLKFNPELPDTHKGINYVPKDAPQDVDSGKYFAEISYGDYTSVHGPYDKDAAMRIAKYFADDFAIKSLNSTPEKEVETIDNGYKISYIFLGTKVVFKATIFQKK